MSQEGRVERFTALVRQCIHGSAVRPKLVPADNGRWVRYKDHQAEIERLENRLRNVLDGTGSERQAAEKLIEAAQLRAKEAEELAEVAKAAADDGWAWLADALAALGAETVFDIPAPGAIEKAIEELERRAEVERNLREECVERDGKDEHRGREYGLNESAQLLREALDPSESGGGGDG